MFAHLILGFLRDGRPRHGYEIISQFRARSGTAPNAGNVYRELAKLAQEKLIRPAANPREADARRIPYEITDSGLHAFDGWLLSPSTQDEELTSWILFAHLVPRDALPRLLERLQEQLWLLTKQLARAREDVLARARLNGHGRGEYDPASFLLLLRMKRVAAELDFVEELRREIGGGHS